MVLWISAALLYFVVGWVVATFAAFLFMDNAEPGEVIPMAFILWPVVLVGLLLFLLYKSIVGLLGSIKFWALVLVGKR